jgi:UDP-3-O-[3-hydroxymyristoyl] glucosamine N-acyltransferase
VNFCLGDVAAAAGAELRGGDVSSRVTGLATLQNAGPTEISFFTNRRYKAHLNETRACAVILLESDADRCPVSVLISVNPQLSYARVAALFAPPVTLRSGIHPTAWVSPAAEVALSAWVGPHATIEAGAVIEDDVYIGPNCVVGEGAFLGAGARLVASVTICRGVRLGQRVLVHPGAVIGSDGFGLANVDGQWIKIPQLGSVRIGNDVEIGANTTIDRGALEDTVIEEGVKLDNQIQIGHNVHIGADCALAGCVGIAGSVDIGRQCTLGGGVGVAGHLKITDKVQITGMSLVTKSISEAGVYSSGLAVEPNQVWNKISARLRRIDELAKRLVRIEKKIFSDDTR